MRGFSWAKAINIGDNIYMKFEENDNTNTNVVYCANKTVNKLVFDKCGLWVVLEIRKLLRA